MNSYKEIIANAYTVHFISIISSLQNLGWKLGKPNTSTGMAVWGQSDL